LIGFSFPQFAQRNSSDTSLYVSQAWAEGNDVGLDGKPTGLKRYQVACLAVVFALIEHARGNTSYRIGQPGTWDEYKGAVAPSDIGSPTTANSSSIIELLKAGNPVVLRGSSPALPYGQHFMLAIGISSSGNIIAYDPYIGQQVEISSKTLAGSSAVGSFTITEFRSVKM